jgi:hypothetical protein
MLITRRHRNGREAVACSYSQAMGPPHHPGKQTKLELQVDTCLMLFTEISHFLQLQSVVFTVTRVCAFYIIPTSPSFCSKLRCRINIYNVYREQCLKFIVLYLVTLRCVLYIMATYHRCLLRHHRNTPMLRTLALDISHLFFVTAANHLTPSSSSSTDCLLSQNTALWLPTTVPQWHTVFSISYRIALVILTIFQPSKHHGAAKGETVRDIAPRKPVVLPQTWRYSLATCTLPRSSAQAAHRRSSRPEWRYLQ